MNNRSYLEVIGPKVEKFEKRNKKLEDNLASKTKELNEMTTKFQGNIIVVDKLDTILCESLDKHNAKAKKKIASLELNNPKLKSSLNDALGMFRVKDSQNRELGQTITTLEARNVKLETELSILKKDKAVECAIASVSPRCEANNVFDDRVRMLELENSNLNEIIKKFTSS